MTSFAGRPFHAFKSFLLMASVLLVALPAAAEGRSLYVAGQAALGTVSVIDTANNTVAPASIPVGALPLGAAITADGKRAYVTASGLGPGPLFGSTVSVIDTSTNLAIGGPITVGSAPLGIAMTPDGTRAYVANLFGASVSVIDTNPSSPTYNSVINTIPTPGAGLAIGIAITPDGSRAYVLVGTGETTGVVAKLDINPSSPTYNTFVGSVIDIGATGKFIPGITPDGSKLYVPQPDTNSVKVVDTNPSSGSYDTVTKTISSGITSPFMVGVSPDGSRAYATSGGTVLGGTGPFPNTVAVIDTTTDATTGSPITTGTAPFGVAFSPDGAHAYVANFSGPTVSDVDTVNASTTAITMAAGPTALAIPPAQGAVADFSATAGASRSATTFSAAAAENLNGTEARYDWNFGDGTSAANAGRTPSHTFENPGTYDVQLTVTSNIAPYTGPVFTGQTASVANGPTASKTVQVSVADANAPIVKVKSPRKNQKMKRRKFKRVRGTASDSSGVNKVTYSIFTKRKVRQSKHTRKTTTLCRYLKRNGQLTRYGSCNKVTYLTAKGTTSWEIKIKHLLPRGKYTLYVKATDTRGHTSEPVKVSFRLV